MKVATQTILSDGTPIDWNTDQPFGTLSLYFVAGSDMGGYKPAGPAIVASFDIKRSYIAQYGFIAGRKLPGLVRMAIFEEVLAGSSAGLIRIQEIENAVKATIGVASVNFVSIAGQHADYRTPTIMVTPARIDLVNIKIRNDL